MALISLILSRARQALTQKKSIALIYNAPNPTIPADQADGLKRELLVAVGRHQGSGDGTSTPSSDGRDGDKSGNTEGFYTNLFAQKPLTFDPVTGSITVSSIPHEAAQEDLGDNNSDNTYKQKLLFQFCIRDKAVAVSDLAKSCASVGHILDSQVPLAVMLLGSMDRGNKVFRYGSWESVRTS